MSTADVAKDARRAVLEHLRSEERFVTVTHEHPDGDAIGSLVAATRMLQAMGKDVVAVVAPGDLPLSREYAGLATVDLATAIPVPTAACANVPAVALPSVTASPAPTPTSAPPAMTASVVPSYALSCATAPSTVSPFAAMSALSVGCASA